jgi:hypothetical protein
MGAQVTLSLNVWVNGVNLSVNIPQTQAARQVNVPPDPVDKVDVQVTNPGPAAVPDVWFGLPDGNTLGPMTRVSELPPGTTEFTLTFPTANLSPGQPYNLVMGDGGDSDQYMSTIAVLFISERDNNP